MNGRRINFLPNIKWKLLISISFILFHNCTHQNLNSDVLNDLYLKQTYNITKDSIIRMNKAYRLFSNVNSSVYINDAKHLLQESRRKKCRNANEIFAV